MFKRLQSFDKGIKFRKKDRIFFMVFFLRYNVTHFAHCTPELCFLFEVNIFM